MSDYQIFEFEPNLGILSKEKVEHFNDQFVLTTHQLKDVQIKEIFNLDGLKLCRFFKK